MISRPLIGHSVIIKASDWSAIEGVRACQLARPQTGDLGKNWPGLLGGNSSCLCIYFPENTHFSQNTQLQLSLCVVLRIRMLKSFLTLCINSGQGCICIIFHEPFVQNLKNPGNNLSLGYERLKHQKEQLSNNIRTCN